MTVAQKQDNAPGIPRLWYVALLPLILVLLGGSAGCGSHKDPLPIGQDSVITPYQELHNSTLFFYDSTIKMWELKAEYMRKELSGGGDITATPVRLTFFDSSGTPGTRILSDSGRTGSAMEYYTIWGNVYIKTDDGQIIETQQLSWNQKTHKVTSNTYVQITTPGGDILRGKGLDAVEDFSSWTLRENVTGSFPKFRKRVEEDDEFL
jgi:LPS export ABC transporter protein LptC